MSAHSVTIGDWQVTCADTPPLAEYAENAALVERFDEPEASAASFIAIARSGAAWPDLVVIQRYRPEGSPAPGVLIVPETARAFIGAGDRLLCYDLDAPRRLWQDWTPLGFWGWHRTDNHVILAGELECAVWTTDGTRLWSEQVEPPWSFTTDRGTLLLDVMGTLRKRRLKDGAALD